ncbi:unnamed protein product [Nippostrongylus brasiliensis]|uniref:Dimer_Tnp_hAT domain-containing protein n=1 Tax=Nippostrongylus brasiliensis TaxID=27835 RepID=A0A0N4YX74_NIPBR|nr:unnamed protein product [Nippostrongylus brasiliensis]
MSKVSFFVADGATVMNSTAMNLSLKYVQCCAHVINLAAKAAIESGCVKQTVQKVRKIVAKLNRSGKAKSFFERLLQEANLPKVLPYTDCPTRWGSMFTMICDVLDLLASLMHPRFAFMETVLPSETWTKTMEKLKRLNALLA